MTAPAAHSAIPDWPRQLQVTDPATAGALASLEQMAFLRAFLRPDGLSIGAAAQHFGLSPNATYRKVKRYQALGILVPCRTATRRGKQVKFYRLAAQRFWIPPQLYPPAEFIAQGMAGQLSVFYEELSRSVQSGPYPVTGLISGDTGTHLPVMLAGADAEPWNPRAPGTPVTKWGFHTLQLDYGRAQSLMRELREVLHRYYDDQGAELYLVSTLMTPVPDASGRDPDSALRVE